MKSKTMQITLGGLLSALAVIVLVGGSALGIATYIAPAVAGLFVYPLALEFGQKPAYIAFGTISVMGAILAPDKELALVFVFFFGYYPVLKKTLEKIKPKVLSYIVKFVVFNVAIIALYIVLLNIIALPNVVQEFQERSSTYTLILLGVGNVTFIMYDYLLTIFYLIYTKKIRKRISGGK